MYRLSPIFLLTICVLNLIVLGARTSYTQTSDVPQATGDYCESAVANAAYAYGLKIQEAVRKKSIAELYLLMNNSDPTRGPRYVYAKDKNFDEVFTPDWSKAVLSSEPDCDPVGWRGYMLGNGMVWYDDIYKADESKFQFNIITLNVDEDQDEPIKRSAGSWLMDGKGISMNCFVEVDYEGGTYFDNHMAINGQIDFEEFKKNIGLYLPSTERLSELEKREWLGDGLVIKELKTCNTDTREERGSYKVYPEEYSEAYTAIPQKTCTEKLLSKSSEYECLETRVVEVTAHNYGGSLGPFAAYSIYGLIWSNKNKKHYITPLVNFDTLNEALNYIDVLR